jgi:subtilisin family serine protease
MRAAAGHTKIFAALLLVAALGPIGSAPVAGSADGLAKLDLRLRQRALLSTGQSRVIVRAAAGMSLAGIAPIIQQAGATLGRRLPNIGSHVAVVPNGFLRRLAASPFVDRVSLDRDVVGTMERTSATVGATMVRQEFGYDGAGVGVAIIDSGVTAWHDDLAGEAGAMRVDRFVDFVGGTATASDDYGHGTHVAGIIAGNGFDSGGARTGIAPGAHLIVLKALDATGRGHISDVIAALDYAVAQRQALNIRVINLSVAAGVYESYNSDPLTVAAQNAVRAGIVVVAAAGNVGRSLDGHTQYGGITAPANAPWVLTVGASSHMGTVDRSDDTVATFSSRGPTAVDALAKPDIVAPGVGIESLAAPGSALYTSAAAYLLSGTVPTSYLPYLSLSGTSAAAPVVTGTIALMLQANPALTPNAVKAILQYTSGIYPSYDPLTEGAGFLNAKGAVELARYLTAPATESYPDSTGWGKQLIWGNRLVTGSRLAAGANAWSTAVTWGAKTTPAGAAIWWGDGGKWRIDKGPVHNVVWGTICGGADCASPWTIDTVTAASGGETVVWGTTDGGETVVWGTTDGGETVVWGTTGDGETVVWGTTADGETVVWGTIVDGVPVILGSEATGETVVWGTSCFDPSCEPVIWNNP